MNTPDPVATPARRLALAALLFALPMAALAVDPVVGSGQAQTEVRAVSGFRAVELRGAMNLVLRQGAREGAEVRADHNLLPLIETRVLDRAGRPTLVIDAKSDVSYSTRIGITVTVDLITLEALTVSGSGDTVCDRLNAGALSVALSGSGDLKLGRLDAKSLELRLSGSGDAEVAGTAARVALSISGSAGAELHGLQADRVAVRITGSGDASVHARRELSASITGSGDLAYAGEPAVTSSVRGSGSVKKLRMP